MGSRLSTTVSDGMREGTHYLPFQTLALSALIIAASFAWQGNAGFSLWDEGFLWYGAERVVLGEVPIRDFMSYDPGRYYWSAAWMWLTGDDGIMSLRGAVAIFQAAGLCMGLWLVAQTANPHSKGKFLYLLLSAVILAVWMLPRHKLFDISLSIFSIGILAFLVQNPSPKRYFIAGLGIGLVAVFGRNHGMYGAAASLGAMAYLNLRRASGLDFKGFLLWAAGVFVGYAPVLLMTLAIPGFAAAFLDSILFLFEQKSTNLPLPVPWPWEVDFASVSLGDAVRGWLVGLFFIAIVAFGALSLLWVFSRKLKGRPAPPVLVAASCLALPYAHFAYSRADVGHLAQGIFPFLVGCLALLSARSAKVKWPIAAALGASSLWVAFIFHPGWQCHASGCESVEISGSHLQIEPGTASDIALLRRLAAQYAPNDRNFIVTPLWPGAYPVLDRKSPMWEIYALWPRSPAFEQAEIERIKAAKPGFAFVFDLALDGREDLRFRNTHPRINQYILENFDPVPASNNSSYRIYRAKGDAQ